MTAQRVAGKTPEQRQKQVAAASAFLLFALPSPLVVMAALAILGGRIVALAWCVGIYALFMVGASLARSGLARAIDYDARRIARPPPPLRLLGAAVVGLATFAAAWILVKHTIPISLAFAAAAVAGTLFLYGVDPLRAKFDTAAGADGRKVVRALEAARAKLARIDVAGRTLGDGALRDRVAAVVRTADDVLGEIERDPKDLRRARKFLNVYLDEAADVVEKYAGRGGDPGNKATDLDTSFADLLADMEHVFREQHEVLMRDDVMDLDIQMDVLRTRLKREGVL